MKEKTIAFFDIVGDCEKESVVGAALVLNEFGIPQEFKCTNPIETTKVQKVVYGSALRPHVGITICGKPLIDSLTSTPALFIVKRRHLLDLRHLIDKPVFLLHSAGGLIEIKEKRSKGETYKLKSKNTNFKPIHFAPHAHYAQDFEDHQETVQGFFDSFDLFEPFDRLSKAVELVSKQEGH